MLLGLLGEVMRTCLVSVEDTEDTDEITAVSPSSSSSTSVQKRRMGCKKAVYRQHICKTINWINQVVARKNYPFLYFAQHSSAIFTCSAQLCYLYLFSTAQLSLLVQHSYAIFTFFSTAQLSLLFSAHISYLYFVQHSSAIFTLFSTAQLFIFCSAQLSYLYSV